VPPQRAAARDRARSMARAPAPTGGAAARLYTTNAASEVANVRGCRWWREEGECVVVRCPSRWPASRARAAKHAAPSSQPNDGRDGVATQLVRRHAGGRAPQHGGAGAAALRERGALPFSHAAMRTLLLWRAR
jgi:hypothetical protein